MPANSFNGTRAITADVHALAHYDLSRADTTASVTAIPGGGTIVQLPDRPSDGDWYLWANPDNSASVAGGITLALSADALAEGLTIQGASSATFEGPGASGMVVFLEKSGAWALFPSGGASSSGVLPNPSWLVPNWYVDWNTGNDANPGTLAEPVKSVMGGVVAKWATESPTLAQPTTIHVLVPQPLNAEYIVLRPVLANGGSFDILVTPVAIGAPFAAGAVTAKTRGAPGNSLEVAGFVGAGIAALQLVHNTAPDSWGAIDGLAGGVATMCQPWDSAGLFTLSAVALYDEENGWAPGQTLQCYEQGLLNLKVLEPSGGDSNPAFTAGICSVQNAFIPDVSGVPGDSVFLFHPKGCGGLMVNCRIDPFLQFNADDDAFTLTAINCIANGGMSMGPGSFLGGSANTSLNEFNETRGLCIVDGDAIIHGHAATASLFVHGGSGYCVLGFVQFPEASIIALAHGAYVLLEPGQIASPVGCQVWGAAGMNTEGSSRIELNHRPSWAVTVTLSGGLSIEGATTGGRYLNGRFILGYPLTTANLDLYSGLTSGFEAFAGYISNNAPAANTPVLTPGANSGGGTPGFSGVLSDLAGVVTITPGGGATSGPQLVVAFSQPFDEAPTVTLTAANPTAATSGGFWVDTVVDAGFTINIESPAAALYAFSYSVDPAQS